MSNVVETNQATKRPRLRSILRLLTLISSPLCCCGLIILLDIVPGSFLPPPVDFVVNLFETGTRIENRSAETLYITPITTIYGEPVVIAQLSSLQTRDIPLRSNDSLVLSYDAADMPLSGIAVCQTDNDCRLLAVDQSTVYSLDNFESLPKLDPGWLLAIRSTPKYNIGLLLIMLSSLLPVLLLFSWLYVGRLENKRVV